MNSDLASALENGSPSSPHSLPADNVSSDIDLRIHKASLLQGYVVIQICFDGGTFLSHDFGFDGSDFLHWHGLGQRPAHGKGWWTTQQPKLVITDTRIFILAIMNIIRMWILEICFLPDLVSLHNALFVALQTGCQTFLVEPHAFFILELRSQKHLYCRPVVSFIKNLISFLIWSEVNQEQVELGKFKLNVEDI